MSFLMVVPFLEKARKNIYKLIPKRITAVRKDGTTYQTTVYVKPGEIEEEKTQMQFDFDVKPSSRIAVQKEEEENKKPWEMTRDEYFKWYLETWKKEGVKDTEPDILWILRNHEFEVEQALKEDEKVSPGILKDYPGLSSKKKKYYEDVGEKIGGAKKDIWAAKLAEMNLEDIEEDPKEAYQIVSKDNILGKFDTEFYKEQGYSSQATQLIKELYTSIAPRPQDHPEARQAYVQYLHDIQDAIGNARSVQDCANSLAELMALKDKIPAFQEKIPAGKKHIYYAKPNALNEIYSVFGSRGANTLYMIATHNDMGIKPIGTRMTNDQYWKLKEKCTKLWQLEKTDADNWEWAEPKKKKEGEKKKKWMRIVDEEVNRTAGREVKVDDPVEYLKTFGIRAVEYGNYVAKDKEAGDYHTRRCAEALSDLADILEVEDKQISFNGRLALAFGARGSGRASAHYEPVKTVINMTKFRGGGSLAHEWFHFIDNIFYEVENNKKQSRAINYLSKEKKDSFTKSEVKKAFESLMDIMRYKQIENEIPVQKYEGIIFENESEKTGFETIFNHAKKIYQRQVYREPSQKPNPIQNAVRVMKYNADKFFGKGKSEDPTFIEKFTLYSINRCLESGMKLPNKVLVNYKAETDFYGASRRMGGYWMRNNEMTARAFESYIADKLEKNGRKSTYLVSGSKSELYQSSFGNIYPGGSERKNLYNAFERLIEVMRKEKSLEKAMKVINELQKETENGINLIRYIIPAV